MKVFKVHGLRSRMGLPATTTCPAALTRFQWNVWYREASGRHRFRDRLGAMPYSSRRALWRLPSSVFPSINEILCNASLLRANGVSSN